MALTFKWVDKAAGNDTNDGNTEATAYASLDKIADLASPTVVFIKSGVYWLSANVTYTNSSAYVFMIVGIGRVIIRQPNAYAISMGGTGGTHWHNIIFMNSGTPLMLVTGGTSTYPMSALTNCVVAQPQLLLKTAAAGTKFYATNVTTPSGTTLTSPISATVLNVAYGTVVATIVNSNCAAESGSYIGGMYMNPSGLFASLVGAYPILPRRIATLNPTKMYPSASTTGTVLSTTGGTTAYFSAAPQQPPYQYGDADAVDGTLQPYIQEFTSISASNTRYNVDYGSAITAEGLFLVNGYGAQDQTKGVKSFVLQGSNSASAFTVTTYATDTDWVDLCSGSASARSSVATTRSQQTFTFENSTPYQYYSLKLVNNRGGITNIMFNKFLITAKNTFTYSDLDTLKVASQNASHFPASSTGWCNDTTYTSGSATVDDTGITVGSGTSARVVGPVGEYGIQVVLRNVAVSGLEAASPNDTKVEYRISDTLFYPSATSPSWNVYSRNSDIAASGSYLQYRLTLYVA